MSYTSVLAYMYRQLPMYQRIGDKAFKKTLNNIIKLCEALDQPQKKFKTVHIAGTNGKGSVSHMLASVFQTAGYNTGLYTSPHLKDFRERIKLNGKMISKYRVEQFVLKHKLLLNKLKPSFFEITVAMAFDFFAKKKVDIAIIETGLGGRLDSTNIINPKLSIITNISKDHTAMLGNTLKQIAKEKAGIIKPGVPVVLGEYSKEYYHVIKKVSESKKSILHIASKKYRAIIQSSNSTSYQKIKVSKNQSKKTETYELDLLGNYQANNLCTVLSSIELLSNQYNLSPHHIKKGLKYVIKKTGMSGRWQVLKTKPLTICDTAHNLSAIKFVLKQLKSIPCKKLHMVIGMVSDKDVEDILKVLPKQATYYFCMADIPRGLDPNILQKYASKHKLHGSTYNKVKSAYSEAIKHASKNDVIFIGGSAFVVAEVL